MHDSIFLDSNHRWNNFPATSNKVLEPKNAKIYQPFVVSYIDDFMPNILAIKNVLGVGNCMVQQGFYDINL